MATVPETHANHRARLDTLTTRFTKLHVFIRSSVEMNKLWHGWSDQSALVSDAGDCSRLILV
jgi:hypothetical protein